MKEFLQNLFSAANERVKNPFIGAIAFSWFVLNWKAIMIVLFSERSFIERVRFVEFYYSNNWTNYILPLVFAVFYVIGFPYLMACFDWITKWGWRIRLKNRYIQMEYDFDQKIKLARKEFELEETKTGKRELAILNENNTQLTRQVDELIESNKKLRELLSKDDYVSFYNTFDASKSDEIAKSESEKFKDILDRTDRNFKF